MYWTPTVNAPMDDGDDDVDGDDDDDDGVAQLNGIQLNYFRVGQNRKQHGGSKAAFRVGIIASYISCRVTLNCHT
jgi:hypothetical protein